MTSTTQASASSHGSSLLPPGYLSTSGGQIMAANGTAVTLESIAWFGTEGPSGSSLGGLSTNNPSDPATAAQITSYLTNIANEGFNTVRIPWSDVNLQAALPLLQAVVAEAGTLGLRIIFDHHDNNGHWSQQGNGLWFDSGPGSDGTDGNGDTGTITAAQFQADSVTLAKTFAGNSTVAGFDLDNEPFLSSSNGVNWGGGGPTDIQAMYNTVGSAVEAADPGALIIAEGPQNWTGTLLNGKSGLASEGDLSEAAAKPVTLTVNGSTVANKVVYSVHEYPSTIGGEPVDSGSAYIAQMNAAWGYLEAQNIAPVWIGEMGGSLDSTGVDSSSASNLANEQAWAATIVPYLNGQDAAQGGPSVKTGFDWWASGTNLGYDPDEYNSGPNGAVQPGQQAVVSQLLTYINSTPATGPSSSTPSSNDTVVLAGSSAGITDTSGHTWTITNGGQVAVNGTADTTTASVIELAYVNGTIWQENASKLWWGETSPNSAWSPSAGTATSPLPPIPVKPAPSLNDTVVMAGSTAPIIDASGNAWTITSGAQVAVNGVADTATGTVAELAYVNGTIWQENTANLWWGETTPSAAWAGTSGTATSPLPASGTIRVYGAANSGVITLGSANALVYLGGAGETVDGGSGNAAFYVTAATIGATITGGSGSNTLDVQGGGGATMGTNITGVQSVFLDDAAYNFVANSTAALAIHAGAGTDTVTLGAASQAVFGSGGSLTVQATAANAGAVIHAGSGAVTLAVTTAGTVAVASADSHITLQLAAADTLVLPANTSIVIDGSATGGDNVLVTDGILRGGQSFTGSGTNTLLLQGAGLFNLSAPATLTGIGMANATGAAAGQTQSITLRAGLDLTLNVLDAAAVTVRGAANNDVINLGAGNSAVFLGGAGETVSGGSGTDIYYVTAATMSATISGGSGSNTLHVQGGGSAVMGANVTGIPTIDLDNAASSYSFVASTTAGLAIHASTGNDSITVGAASQTVFGSSGSLTIKATATTAGAAIHTGSGGATLQLTTGGAATLNAADTNLTVTLAAATNLNLGALSFITAIGTAAGGSSITAGGARQTLESTGGKDTLTGSSSFGDTFLGTAAGLAGDTIANFGGSDVIDITDLAAATLKPLVFNASTDALTVADGTHGVTLTMSGNYTLASFTATSDGHTGVLLKFV
ncbi:cellulase family glycosylhydrolase [Rhodopila sp.]|uniref:cellulase family glycosylhydrolase n=1 Tax=Rhodopila sp. TaxID=2480087 RepID=UPI003D139DB2